MRKDDCRAYLFSFAYLSIAVIFCLVAGLPVLRSRLSDTSESTGSQQTAHLQSKWMLTWF